MNKPIGTIAVVAALLAASFAPEAQQATRRDKPRPVAAVTQPRAEQLASIAVPQPGRAKPAAAEWVEFHSLTDF